MKIQTVIHATKPKRVGGKMKQLGTLALLILLAGCAFNIEDWEPNGEDLHYAMQRCRSEMLLRDPKLAKDLNAGLVVMGTVFRTGIPGLIIGNTAETVMNKLECSILAIKPQKFVTNVTLKKIKSY